MKTRMLIGTGVLAAFLGGALFGGVARSALTNAFAADEAVTEQERRCWELVMRLGEAVADAVAEEVGMACESCRVLLEGLARRRLLRRVADRYLPLGAAA